MRAFVLLCVCAVACAQSDGYHYQPSHGEALLSEPIVQQPIQQPIQQPLPQPISQSHPQPLPQPLPQPIPQPLPQPIPQQPSLPAAQIEEYQKEFYSYSAPEEQPDDTAAHQQINSSIKKNLRVVFIRAPEQRGIEQAALQLAQQAGEQNTAIYVLTKQPDIGNLAQQLQSLKTQVRSKPEVHFVKYRTPQDAANAQAAIQNQYNQLPGSSHSSDEGTAPVLNFASRPPIATGGGGGGAPAPTAPAAQYLPAQAVPSQNYLPPSLRRYRIK